MALELCVRCMGRTGECPFHPEECPHFQPDCRGLTERATPALAQTLGREPCVICGALLNAGRAHKLVVNYDNALGAIIPPDATPPHGEYGFLPIGSDCAKTVAKGWVVDATDWPDIEVRRP